MHQIVLAAKYGTASIPCQQKNISVICSVPLQHISLKNIIDISETHTSPQMCIRDRDTYMIEINGT